MKGAERWIAGEITTEELYHLDWYAEAEAFLLDYAKDPDELLEIETMIAGVEELQDLPFEEARRLLTKAAYFAEGSMIYPTLRMGTAQKRPERAKLKPERWSDRLFRSEFLCPDLLRSHIWPDFEA
ncbi:MAG: hypothetical protein HRT64_05050 [Erythrobacter sp.]|nr:hypothetical protein [Erythrobacter sp.]